MALRKLFVSGHWRRRGAATSRLAGLGAPPGRWWGGGGLGGAGPEWAKPSANAARAGCGARARARARGAAAAAMRWVRALLKNASLAGAPKYIEHFSKFSPSPLSMKQFLDFGTRGREAAGHRDLRGRGGLRGRKASWP